MRSGKTSGSVIRPIRVVYVERPGTTPQSEAEALAAVYRFLLESYESKATETISEDEDRQEEGRTK